MECHSTIKGNEVLLHVLTRMHLEDMILSERSKPQKTAYYMTVFM